MNIDNNLHFEDLLQEFIDSDLAFSPAEVHGFLTGHLCIELELTLEQWLQTAHQFMSVEQFSDSITFYLTGLYDYTKEALVSDELTFSPYVLDDDDCVEEKLLVLAQWCQGFVIGISTYGKSLGLSLSADTKEAILDLTKISQMDTGKDIEDVQEKENIYSDILEYVRMAVIAISDEYFKQPSTNTPAQWSTMQHTSML